MQAEVKRVGGGLRLTRPQIVLLQALCDGPLTLRQWNLEHEWTRRNLERRGYAVVHIRNLYVDSTVEITDEGRSVLERLWPRAQELWGLS